MSTLPQRWVSPVLAAEGDAVAVWAATTLAAALASLGVRPDGLYLATPDAGSREALAFWRAATETGYRFASPAAFPWTLSNSPAGRISLELGITGPCTTLVGDVDAVVAARESAQEDQLAGRVRLPLVVHLRGDRPVSARGEPARHLLSAWLPSTDTAAPALGGQRAGAGAPR